MSSHPDNVCAGCHIFRYHNHISHISCNSSWIVSTSEKNSNASEIYISSTSAIFFHFHFISIISDLYLVHLHKSHGTYVSGKNWSSTFLYQYQLHAGQQPFHELKLKAEAKNQRYFACVVFAYKFLILSKVPTKVTGQLLGVFHILLWST